MKKKHEYLQMLQFVLAARKRRLSHAHIDWLLAKYERCEYFDEVMRCWPSASN